MQINTMRRGFTLIELLIVVAIIAILAAIAVPNFLEAQVRAKVSRVKSDMRSAATAMESYHVDHNKYPLIAGQVRLTTPIAYLTSWPKSPFKEPTLGDPGVGRRWETLPPNAPTFILTTESTIPDPLPQYQGSAATTPFNCDGCEDRDYIMYASFSRNPTNISAPTPAERAQFGDRSRWNFKSVGPDADDEVTQVATGAAGAGVYIYDPTNGTVSSGDLLMFGPGLGFQPPQGN